MIMHVKDIITVKKIIPYGFVVMLALTSCKVLQPHKMPDLSTDPKLYRELSQTDSTNMADVPWRQIFTDPALQKLIEEAIRNNPDLQIAVARMEKTKANLRQSRQAFFPTLNANAGAVLNNKNSDGSGVVENYEIYGSSSWEIDIWGKLRSAKRANLAAFLESEAYKQAVQTALIANVANTYYTLLADDAKLRITEQTLAKRKDEVEVIQAMKDNDVVTGADLVMSQANRYAAEVSIPEIKQSIYETENALSILLGRNPGPIERGTLEGQEISAGLKSGVPAQLLANRPDVKEAEFRFRYYFEMTNVARTYFYPSLTITASGGFTETDLSKLFNITTLVWNVAGGLTQPLFNQGLNRQRLENAMANEEEYLIAFKQSLLSAGAEVANAMHGYQTATEKMALRELRISYLEKSVDFTMELLKYTSNTNYTDVLTAEVNLLAAQLNLVNDKLEQLQSAVSLYQSLGGGCK